MAGILILGQRTVSSINAPSIRYGSIMVLAGTYIVVWGGVDTSNVYVRTGGIFNPSTNTWESATSTAFAPLPTGSEIVTWTGTEMKVVIGTSTHYYNPTTDIWRQ